MSDSSSFRSKIMLPCMSLFIVLLVASGAVAQGPAPGSGSVADFVPVAFLVDLDEKPDPEVEVFQSRSTGAFLILSSELPAPVRIRLREAQVETITLMKVNRNEDGTVELLAGATLEAQPPFQLTTDRSGLEFRVGEIKGLLREKPPLLGSNNIAGLLQHSPEYRRTADAYTPSDPIVNKLRDQTGDVEVRVFFGSWCSHCKQMVPRIMKVAEQLEGSKITFDFYGLPPFSSPDPYAEEIGINAVPTGVIYLEGKEIGRVSGSGWKVPELAINNLLVGDGNPTS